MNIDRCVDLALARLPLGIRDRFSHDPVGVLTDELGMHVQPVNQLADERADGGFCDGMSYLRDGVVLYRPTPTSRRQNFTLAHELGHVLANEADVVLDWLGDNDPDGHLLETVCDRIAQNLLLPEGIAASVVGRDAVAAQHVVDLYEATQASRPVCIIALTRQFSGLGAIALLDRYNGEVTGASVNPDPDRGWPAIYPWRGQALKDGHTLLELAPGVAATRRISWRSAWGSEADFYVNALASASQVICVFAETDIWNRQSPAPLIAREFDQRPTLRGFCCGRGFEMRGFSCPVCHRPFCPRCKRCRCDRDDATDVQCSNCFLLFKPDLIEDGRCEECRA